MASNLNGKQHDSSVRLYIEQQVAGWIREQGGNHFTKRSRQPTTLARATVELITSFLNAQRCFATPLVQVAFHYAETYVRRAGLCLMDAFDILLTSSIIAVKFWKEERSNINLMASSTFNISVSDIHKMERDFLKGIDYELYLTAQEIEYLHDTITTITSPKNTRSKRRLETVLPQQLAKKIKC